MSLNALKPVVIISRQAEAVIAIGINHVRAAMHPIEARHIAPNQQAVNQLTVNQQAVNQLTVNQSAVNQPTANLLTVNQQAVLQRAVQAAPVQAVVTKINPIQQTTHPYIAVELKRSQRPRRTHTILMMMDMRIFTWMAIMTMKDTTGIAIMLMV